MPIIIWNCLWFEGNCYLLVFESHNQLDIGQWNFCFRTYSYILVHGLGLGLGLIWVWVSPKLFGLGLGFAKTEKVVSFVHLNQVNALFLRRWNHHSDNFWLVVDTTRQKKKWRGIEYFKKKKKIFLPFNTIFKLRIVSWEIR